jgi:hypothetical protein
MSTTAFLRESITDLNAFIAPGTFQRTGPIGLYESLRQLRNEEVEALISFLLAQR